MFLSFFGRRQVAFHEALRALDAYASGLKPLNSELLGELLVTLAGGWNRRLARRRSAHIVVQLRCAIAERSGDIGGFYASAVLDSDFELRHH